MSVAATSVAAASTDASAAAAAASPDDAAGAAAAQHDPLALEELFAGDEQSTIHGAIFVHELVRGPADQGYVRLLAALREASERLAAIPDAELGPAYAAIRHFGLDRVAFLDLETGGLAGQPVFLAGILRLQRSALAIRQAIVRRYDEEPALIAWVERELAGVPVVVTYNGKSFDLPMLVDRAGYHGMLFRYHGLHLDLLHPARRRYRDRYPDCRLVTLEWYVCHRRRMGDVPGGEIPGIFHRFMRDGDPTPLVPILHHNALDLVTLAELFGHLAPEPPGPRFVPDWDTIQDQIAGRQALAE
jgi:uncharacterized protein YprB with RNaseH-like and TPR domain